MRLTKSTPHPVDQSVGQQIRYRRWQLDMSQAELAGRIGVTWQQVQKYETGANRVSASRLWEAANALDVPITYFFAHHATKTVKESR